MDAFVGADANVVSPGALAAGSYDFSVGGSALRISIEKFQDLKLPCTSGQSVVGEG
jgi:hypothetical protein